MDFIAKEDYSSRINADVLEQLLGGDDAKLEDPEADAAQLIADRLSAKYNISAELGKTGAARNRSLVRWMLCLSLYYLYGSVADDDIPARVVKDYDDVIAELNRIAGNGSCELQRITDSTTGQSVSNIGFVGGPSPEHTAF